MISILRLPAARRLFVASCVQRLPMGAVALLLVLLTHDLTGSYAAAGAAAAAYVIALGLSGPVLGRMLDRGHGRVITIGGGAVAGIALTAEALVPEGRLAPVGVIAAAMVAGLANPPLGGRLRALWRDVLPTRDLVSRAFALEASVLEIVYIFGPVVIVGALGSWSLRGAFVACGVAVFAGSVAFAAAEPPYTERPADSPATGRRALGDPGVRVLIVVMAACGLAAGGVEVAVPAILGDLGHRSLTGLLLGVWGAGSLTAGLVAGHVAEPRDWPRRLAAVMACWGILHALVGLASSVAALSVALFLAGATIAPTLMASNRVLDDLAPDAARTEAFTWLSTGFTAGTALGSALGGTLIEVASPGVALSLLGFAVAPGVALLLATRHSALRAAGPRPA